MRITGSSSAINVFSSGSSLSKASVRNSDAQKLANGIQRKDTTKISPMGKLNNMLENLTKQKERIAEQRTALIGKTMEKGRDLRSIQPQLTAFDEQISGIEKQMADLIAAQAEKVAKQAEEKIKKEAKKEEPKTEEEIALEKQNTLVRISSDISASKVISSVKTKLEGEKAILKAEIGPDKLRSDIKLEKYRPRYYTPTHEVIGKKVSQLDEVEAKIKNITKKLAATNNEISKELAENSKTGTEKPSEKAAEKPAESAESEAAAEQKAE